MSAPRAALPRVQSTSPPAAGLLAGLLAGPAAGPVAIPAKKSILNTLKNTVRTSTKVAPLPPTLPTLTPNAPAKSFLNRMKNTVKSKATAKVAPPATAKPSSTIDKEFERLSSEMQLQLRRVYDTHKSTAIINRSTVNTRKLRKNMEKTASHFIEGLPKPSTRKKGRFWHLLEKPHM